MSEDDETNIRSKLLEHDSKFATMASELHELKDDVSDMKSSLTGICEQLDPITNTLRSIALMFKVLLGVGAGSAALVGILELINYFE